jgi:hypothetical protein
MAQITRMDVTTSTGDNGTNGTVILGIGGREFVLDRTGRNDFKQNTNDHFVLGAPNNVDVVANSDFNDPNKLFPLRTEALPDFPIYVRHEGADAWRLNGVTITITSSQGTQTLTALPGSQNLVLGPESGRFLFIRGPQG